MRLKIKLFSSVIVGVGLLSIPVVVSAAPSTIVIRPSNTQGWASNNGLAETRSNGHFAFIADATSPLPSGALQLATGSATGSPLQDKVQYMHSTSTPLANVTKLAYSTKQNSASFVSGDPSYQLPVCFYGVQPSGICVPNTHIGGKSYTTFVYEPYIDQGNAAVVNGIWQSWDVSVGKFWSTQTDGDLIASQGAQTYTLAQLKTDFPNAVVVGYGVDVGSNNPNYNTEVDKLIFNDTTYNFEQDLTYPTTKAECRNGGWKTFTGVEFENLDRCLDYAREHSTTIEGDATYSAYGLVRMAHINMTTANQSGWFNYRDVNDGFYHVDISKVAVSGHNSWFAGVVTRATNPSWVGKWLFVKVTDGSPGNISGSFTTESAAKAGVSAMTNPADGPFNVTRGSIELNK
jgi:hypothetical protein